MVKSTLKGFIIVSLLLGTTLANAEGVSEKEDAKKRKDIKEIKIDPETEKIAYKLFETLKLKEGIRNALNTSLETQFRRNPAMAPYKDIYQKFFDMYTKWEDMKKDLAKAYASKFSAEEMKKLTEFYSSDIGKKSLAVLPSLSAFAMRLAQVRIASHSKELKDEVAKRAKELQEKKAKKEE
jgi:hypothetical protein